MHLESFFNNNNNNNNFVYCVDTARKLNYGEFLNLSRKTASLLADLGVSSDDRVFFSTTNSIELYLAWLATIILGAEIVLIDPNYSDDLTESIFNKLNPILFVSEQKEFSLCKVLRPSELCKLINLYKPYVGFSMKNPNVISFTSGTESLPKGVVRDVGSYIDNAIKFSSEVCIDSPNKNILSTFPGYYLGGFYNLFLIPIVNGWKITIIPDFSPALMARFWSIVKENSVDILWLVPSIINLLNIFESRKREKKHQDFSSLVKIVLCGTAPLLHSSREQFKENFGLEILENYALSETLFISSQHYGDKNHSVGKLMPYVEINSAQGIEVKTPYLLNKYLILDGEDKVFDSSEFFNTGDIGEVICKNLMITGRKKDVIIKGGINISPKYIEEQLDNIDIDEIAVIGAPDEISGEKIICYYVSSIKLDSKLRTLSKSKLSSIFRPDKFIKIDKMPKTSSGKTIKKQLRDLYK